MSDKLNILFTGATGYIGGSVLAKLLEHPKFSSFNVTAIVRDEKKAEKLRALGIKTAVGSHSDKPFVEKLAEESDIVIATANADDPAAADAVLSGFKKRFEKKKAPGIFIHTSGTGVLADDARGAYSTDTIYDDTNPEQIESLAPTQVHRNVDLALLKGDSEGYVKTYIILPSTIYGIADHKLVKEGISNPHSIQIPALIRAAIARKEAGMVGEGKNIWPNVHIDEVADIYTIVLNAILEGKNPGHGREGFYFGESGEHTLYDVGKRIAEVLVAHGLAQSLEPTTFTKEDVDKYLEGSYYLGSNSRCRANRARALGWQPKKTTKDMLESIAAEVQAIDGQNVPVPPNSMLLLARFCRRHLLNRLSPSASLFSSNHHPRLSTMSSVKTLAVLDESQLQDGQMKEVEFEDGKVLLSRLGDKIHATSAFCTHYGAPLAKGVLTADGRVVCPWHGACFNVCTGDIEDAPAPSALHSFKAHVADGKIHVTANVESTKKANLSRQPKLLATGSDATGRGVVIIGGGSGAFHAVESLREHGYSAPITVLSKETYTPIDRTKLSKALITDSSKIEWRNAADFKIKYGTNLRLGVEVTGVDLEKKLVIVDNGKDALPYDKLIIAPGGTPRRLPIENANLENVFTFRGIADSQKVDAAAQEGKRAIVIGSSFISMELVAAMAKRKLASVDVIGQEEYPFERILGKEIGAALQKYHESQGVRFHMKSSIDKIVKSEENPSVASGVVVNGETLPADFIIMGVGVAPATGFLKGSGINIEKDGGIKVDQYLRVKSGPDTQNVYAIGDVAIYPQQNGDETRIEHWNVAGNHGRAVGSTIAGKEQPFVKIPVFWSAQGQQLRYCGIGHNYDRVIVKGKPEELKFVAYYVKNDKIVAVARWEMYHEILGQILNRDFHSMQSDPVVSKASELLRLGLMPSPAEVEAGKDLLTIDIATTAALQKVES
ncbi:hypothetical protein NMY22_g5598 [Coprinellus aureogranulatus]|nr:hypothetical protein NMY22_g5598 [Coprinellus aureogranulatus]